MTVMAADQQDARVPAAAAHWANRFVANGTDYGDFQATLARITRWDDWCREWGVTAARYERLPGGPGDAGHPEAAAGGGRPAAPGPGHGASSCSWTILTSSAPRTTARSPATARRLRPSARQRNSSAS